MRKIEIREIKEKKESRNKIIISLILVGLLVLSTAGYALYSTTDKEKVEEVDYNGLKFVKNNGFWNVIISEQGFSFQNLPNETLNIQVSLQRNFNEFANKPLYFSEQSPGSQEILMNIGAYVQRVQLACVSEPCKENLPIKNCSDSNFIIFQSGEINKVSSEENCIYILYKTGEDIKTSDAFLYRILGVI